MMPARIKKGGQSTLFDRLTHHATNLGKTIGSTLTQGAKQVQATVKKATTTTPAVAKPVVHTTITRPLTQKEKEEKKRKTNAE